MTSATSVLTAGGILRAAEVIELAGATGLNLAAAATMLIKESAGGKNVWGSDGVNTAGTYTKGGAVTQANYLAYRDAVHAGRAGRQGCGPCQLTYGGYQDQADALGGCWDWRNNVRVGFGALAALIRTNGTRNGFRAYNGSGAAAEAYAVASMALYSTWHARLDGCSTDPEDDDMQADEVRAIVREELAKVATREDLGYARNQVLSALGAPDPEHAPATPAKGAKTVSQQLADIQTLLAGVVASVAASVKK